jgi:hypothetical protein
LLRSSGIDEFSSFPAFNGEELRTEWARKNTVACESRHFDVVVVISFSKGQFFLLCRRSVAFGVGWLIDIVGCR